jgi:hypothetical protein
MLSSIILILEIKSSMRGVRSTVYRDKDAKSRAMHVRSRGQIGLNSGSLAYGLNQEFFNSPGMASVVLTSCESEVVLCTFLRKMLKTRGLDRSSTSSFSIGSVTELSIGSGSATSCVLRKVLS